MKKILVVNDFTIFPIVHGGKVRIFNIYQNISSNFQIIYVCLGENPKIQNKIISENFHEISVPKTFFYKIIIFITNLMMRSSVDDFGALFFASSNLQLKKVIRKELAECDIVIFCHPYMYPAVAPYIRNQLVIYEALNVEYALKKSILSNGYLKNILLDRLRMTGQALLKRCDLCFAMSEDDKQLFTQVYDVDTSKIKVAPNGVDLEYYTEIYKSRLIKKEQIISAPLILFLGSGHPPNVESAKQIIRNIAPKLPNVYFLIAGSVCWTIRNENHGKNVGFAYLITDEEKRELFRVTNVAINPMMSGSGTNLKMLDYMAAGLPVVSTAVGARGINLKNGIHAIICDIDAFPEKISDVINDKNLSEFLSSNGRDLVKAHYVWKEIAELMVNEIKNATGKK
ncbi:MAG: glycosyltransferase family 4 protein [Methanoregula sp.]|nr:glycosyltransferase family 4 protein [Methanoregula sp.]